MNLQPSLHGVWILLLAMFSLQPLRVNAAISPEVAVEKISELQTLSQRIVAIYCQLGQDVNFMSAKEQLGDSIKRFEQELADLAGYDGTDIQDKLKLIKELWEPLRQAAKGEIAQGHAERLDADAERLLQATGQLLQPVLKGIASGNAGKILLTSRQRLLTHRMSKGYLLMSWGVNTEKYRTDYDQATVEFEEGMLELETASDNPAEIADQLKQTAKKWNTFRYSNKIDPGRYYPGLVVKMLEKIDEMLKEVLQRYIATA